MSEELPAGWANFALTDIGGVSGGKTPSKANPEFWSSRDVPWISPKDMKKDLLGDSEDRISQIALDEAGMTRYPAGAVLMVTRSGILQHSFPVALAGVSVTVNQDIKVLRPVVGIDPKFSFYLLKSFSQAILSACSKDGTTVQSIDSEKLESFIFPLPPAAEQIRIAQKLDELLTQVDTIKARIEAIPALLKRFRQSVLAAAVSGRLTEKWRVDSTGSAKEEGASYQSIQVSEPWSHTIEAPANWTSHIFENVIKLIGGSQPPKSEFIFEEGPGLVRLIQIRDYKGDNHKVFIRSEATKKFCSADDVMIGRYGPPIFQILKGLSGAYNVALMKAVPLAGVLQNDYMYRYLQNYKILNFVEAGSDRTAGQSGVNKAFLDKYPIFLPSLTEQTEIVRRVEQLFAFADQLEAKVASAKTRIDHLTQSILAKAFRGELVPQDPNDEPASVLLERIKAERTNAPKAKRSRKASKASV